MTPLSMIRIPVLPLAALRSLRFRTLFFFNVTATTEIYTLSLHDASSDLDRLGDQPGDHQLRAEQEQTDGHEREHDLDRKSTRLNSSHVEISYAVFCLKKKKSDYAILLSCKNTKKQNASH